MLLEGLDNAASLLFSVRVRYEEMLKINDKLFL